jgi:hypothetical protein
MGRVICFIRWEDRHLALNGWLARDHRIDWPGSSLMALEANKNGVQEASCLKRSKRGGGRNRAAQM